MENLFYDEDNLNQFAKDTSNDELNQEEMQMISDFMNKYPNKYMEFSVCFIEEEDKTLWKYGNRILYEIKGNILDDFLAGEKYYFHIDKEFSCSFARHDYISKDFYAYKNKYLQVFSENI